MTITQKNKRITIGLLWHSVSSDNLGVGALTESQISICEDAAREANCSVNYIVFGTQGGRNYAPEHVPIRSGGRISIKQMLLGKSQFLKDIDACDMVLDIGEGDSFADIYGFKRFLFLIVSKIAVLLKGKPLILSPQTIGPFDYFWTKVLSNFVMRKCQRVYARDGLSYGYFVRNGLQSERTDQAIDVAFKLPYKKYSHRNKKTRIGINVSGLLYSGGYTQNNQFNLTVNYPELLNALLAHWLSVGTYEVWLIPHVIPDDLPVEDDRKAILALLEAFPDVKVAPEFASPSEAKSFIASMDFMTGARMHACIAAFSSGVPVVPLAYSRKFNGLFNSLQYQWVADGKMLNTEQAVRMILEGFDNRDQLKLDVISGNKIATQLLNKYQLYLADFMRQLT